MKGKIAFVLGAAVGYVLGTRAGRERYEQIKRGANSVWQTPPVQRGVGVVRNAALGQVDRLKDAALQAGKNLLGGSGRARSADVPSGSGAAPGSTAGTGDSA